MDLFSSNAEDTLRRTVECVKDEIYILNESDLITFFDLVNCAQFIKKHGYSKVCLQFPDSLLQFSVQAALWIEKHINQKVFVLGDTSYGSCCVDELAAEHIEGDVVVHMGHACLSPTSRLPVHYVFPRASLDVSCFVTIFTQHSTQMPGPVLLLYDVAYSHLLDELRSGLLHQLGEKVVVSQLCTPEVAGQPCSTACVLLHTPDSGNHRTTLLGRGYCCSAPASVVYITHKHAQNMLNFALTLRDVPFYTFTGGEIKTLDFNKTLRRRLYLVEKVKDAKTIGIIVGTLSVSKFRDAIERVKQLAKYRGKRCYIFSVGKLNPAKLANFPEIELFVLVSCPEAHVENDKDYLQPVVTLLEAEVALNSQREWNDPISMDFRDLLEGGSHHKPLPDGSEPLSADVSLISNRIRSTAVDSNCSEDSTSQLSAKDNYQISVASSYSTGRSWRGLEQALGETPVSMATMGRSGIPMAYQNEKEHQPS